MSIQDLGEGDDYPASRARETTRRKSRDMVERLSSHIESQQKQIAAELADLAGLPKEMRGSLTEKVTLATETLREMGQDGWQSLVSEFWRLQHTLHG